jgi:hypothetical protein
MLVPAKMCNTLQYAEKQTQNPPPFGAWGFDPPSRHQTKQRVYKEIGHSLLSGSFRMVAVLMAVRFSRSSPGCGFLVKPISIPE